MKIARKNLILFFILGLLVYSIPVVALCSSHCIDGNSDLNLPKDDGCSISYHFFVPLGLYLPLLSMLAVFIFLQISDRLSISPGFFLSLFRPPRLLS